MAAKKRTRPNSDEKTQISISLPIPLIKKLDKMADAENRNRSNYISLRLKELVSK